MGFIVATVVILIVASMPEFRYVDRETNITEVIAALEVADTVCVGWFTLEYFLRLWAAPDRMAYVKDPLCIIDLMAIIPFYIELFFNILGVHGRIFGDLRRSMLVMKILRVMRVLRVLRILKVARYSMGLMAIGQTIRRSWREFLLLLVFMITTNMMFSTALYFVEFEHPGTDFNSIPAAMWL